MKTIDRVRACVCVGLVAGLMTNGCFAQSKGSLFDDDLPATPGGKPASKPPASSTRVFGSVEFGAARTTGEPEHWSHLRLRNVLNAAGSAGALKWRLGGRLDADAAYAGRNEDIYPAEVRKDQRLDFELRENYVDWSAAGLEWRLGKQNIVWGEMVGLFVADVVTPRDLRDFLQTDLEHVRRSQWAARVEHFSGDWHSELVWIPVQTYDRIGKPGADFYPYPAPPTPGYAYVIEKERKPDNDLSNSGLGLRTGVLRNGWDVAAFAYTSRDVSATFERQLVTVPVPATVYTPVHDRIRQFGGTVAKDLNGVVVKGELVWTSGRRYALTRLDDSDGLLKSNALDWAVGLDFVPSSDSRLNLQVFQRALAKHDASMLQEQHETGGSALFSFDWTSSLKTELLWVTSFNRAEGWINPSLTWKFAPSTQLRVGADRFYGPATGMFGRYDDKDRVFAEIRFSY